MKLLRFLFSEKPKQDQEVKYLIAGLGNYDPDYLHTRHNIGFEIVDHLAQENAAAFSSSRLAETAKFRTKGKSVLLIKPTTYMNLSGKAVKYWMDKENIPLENILVITDDINLPLGKLRIRKNGSDGGHNGLKNIQEMIGTTDYVRLRFGIGNTFGKGRQVDFVLGKWEKDEVSTVKEKIKVCSEAVLSFILEGVDRAMNKFN